MNDDDMLTWSCIDPLDRRIDELAEQAVECAIFVQARRGTAMATAFMSAFGTDPKVAVRVLLEPWRRRYVVAFPPHPDGDIPMLFRPKR